MKVLKFNDPLCTDPVIDAVTLIKPDMAIAYMKHVHPRTYHSDEEALHDFIAMNWAWWVDTDDYES